MKKTQKKYGLYHYFLYGIISLYLRFSPTPYTKLFTSTIYKKIKNEKMKNEKMKNKKKQLLQFIKKQIYKFINL